MAAHNHFHVHGQVPFPPIPPLPQHPPPPPPVHPPGLLLYYNPQPHPHARVKWTTVDPPLTSGYKTRRDQRLHEFHCFPKLPVELRLRIWAFTVQERVIEIRSWGNPERPPHAPINFSVLPHKPPLLLSINQESRTEALRIYRRVEIGISTQILDPNHLYVSWRNHPNNPNNPQRHRPSTNYPRVLPLKPVEIYIAYSHDTIYLGPEFCARHLQSFLTSGLHGLELAGVQYLALDRKLWIGQTGGWEYLRNALYSLRSRPLKELYIVPDDEVNSLDDRYYYRPHQITLGPPPCTYKFKPTGQTEYSTTVVENLTIWFTRLWQAEGREPPVVEIKSVKRGGRPMADFKDGIWDVQKWLGDMTVWKNWVPTTPGTSS